MRAHESPLFDAVPFPVRSSGHRVGAAGALRGPAIGRSLWIALAAVLGAAGAPAGASAGEVAVLLEYPGVVQKVGGPLADLTSADVDGDGDVDVLIADRAGSRLRIWTNVGGGAFHESFVGLGSVPTSLACADVDGDGDADVVVSVDGPSHGVRLLLGDGSGGFLAQPIRPFSGGGLQPVSVALRDVDVDGDLDVVVGLGYHASGAGAIVVFPGDGTGALGQDVVHPMSIQVDALVVDDLDGDGVLDVAALGGYLVSPRVRIAFGTGSGTFTDDPADYSAGLYAGSIEAGDWDRDGDVDLATGNKYLVSTFRNDGTGHFSGGPSTNVGYYVKGLAAADMDGDGDLDLAATSGSSSALRVLRNDGGAFAIHASLPASTQAYGVMFTDVSGDGYPDPWAVDVVDGTITHGTSHCLSARFGTAKTTGQGSTPTMGAVGTPSMSGAGLTVTASGLPSSQPAVWIFAAAAQQVPALGGSLLVAPPWVVVPAATSAGSGDPTLDDGAMVATIAPAALSLIGPGVRVQVQVFALDPAQTDGTSAAVTDALWFEVQP